MTSLSAPATSAPSESLLQRRSVFISLASILVLLWAATTFPVIGRARLTEAIHAGGLLGVTLLALAAFRGPVRMSQSAVGRLAALLLFGSAVVLFSPAFVWDVAQRPLREPEALVQQARLAPFAILAVLWFLALFQRDRRAENTEAPSAAERIERAFSGTGFRLNLAAAGLFGTAGFAVFSGVPAKAALLQGALVGAVFFAVRPLLLLLQSAAGARVLCGVAAAVLAACAATAVFRYNDLSQRVALGAAKLDTDQPDEAKRIHDEAKALNQVLDVRAFSVEMERSWAAYHERRNELQLSMFRWHLMADLVGVDRTEFLPAQRVLCKMGDSLQAWRRLVYQGFPAIENPELIEGIEQLRKVAGDGRAKLLAALSSWDQGLAEDERIRRLEEVQAAAPREPSSACLLKRMNRPANLEELWMPMDLIVGRSYSRSSPTGLLDELGEVSTLVVLERGNWEMALRAQGTPLHEIWPVVRVELNGTVIGSTRVTKTEDHWVPFTFDVNQGNVYRLKIVLENHFEDIEQGRIARRGLTLHGIVFRRAKD